VVYINDIDSFNHLADSLQVNTYYFRHTEKAGKELSLNNQQAAILEHSTCIDSMHISIQHPNADAWLRPYGKRTVWSIDNYGPIKVPYKGWQISLNDETMTLYYETIRDWENKIENIDGQFYIDNEKVTHYTFENNYYVMMGDNRHNSIDSRMWGFLPEQNIVGKATNILWSNNHSEMKWNRILKRIN
jgi:signal peptidase I